MTKLCVHKGDITKVAADAIVNAANTTLLGGGGVDGAIHRAAGPGLLEECRTLFGCKTGEAKITKAYSLPAKYVIHTVGPVWNDGKSNEENLLYSAYLSSLMLAREHFVRTIAFPNISTGVYRFPKQLAAETAMNAVQSFCGDYPAVLSEITFVCFDDENYHIYRSIVRSVFHQ